MSAAVVAYSARRVSSQEGEGRQIPLMGVTGAFIFAAQMVNFPIAGGTSGHLVGAVLATLLLGPYASVLIMTAILAVQALLFQDGGLTALGANVLNMGLVGSFVGFLVYRLLRRLLRGRSAAALNAFLASLMAVLVSAAAAALEIGLSGTAPLGPVMAAMLGVHALIGVGEGLITAAALSFLLRVRSDLVHPACQPAALRGTIS